MKTFDNFQLRTPTFDDLPAVVAMRNRWWRALSGNDSTSEEELHAEWNAPNFDLARDCRAATLADGQIVGFASIHSRPPYVAYYVDIQVDPDWQLQGIGIALTSWLEETVAMRLVDSPAEARITLASNILSTHDSARQLLLERGYQLLRNFHEMEIVLDAEPDAPKFPPGIVLKPFDPEKDREAAFLAHQDAFRDHFGHVESSFEEGFPQWWHHITEHPHFDPSTFYLAMDRAENGAEIAGYIFCYPQDYEIADMAWIENLGVRRPWRQQGMGLALLQFAFGEMYRRKKNRVGLAVDADSLTGATRLYEKAGMKAFRRWDRYAKEMRAGKDLMTK